MSECKECREGKYCSKKCRDIGNRKYNTAYQKARRNKQKKDTSGIGIDSKWLVRGTISSQHRQSCMGD